jgi:hypothetical protein
MGMYEYKSKRVTVRRTYMIEFYSRNSVFNNEEWIYSAVACLAEFGQKFPNLN